MIRITERSNDIAAQFGAEERLKSESLHAGHQRFRVGAIAPRSPGDAALFAQLGERAMKRQKRVRRRSEAELAVVLETAPLRRQIQAQAARVSRGGLDQRTPRDREREARHALDAF